MNNCSTQARLATLKRLRETILPQYLDPIPSDDTLRTWFDNAGVPRLKANPVAERGGGIVQYSVSHVEKFLRSRTLPVAR